jgi:hypothetical protein
MGTARIASVAAILPVLIGNLDKPLRLTPVTCYEDTEVRTLRSLSRAFNIPADRPQKLILISRINVGLFSPGQGWENVRLPPDGPWKLEGGPQSILRAVADGSGKAMTGLWELLTGQQSSAQAPPPSSGGTGSWTPPNIYIVQPGDTLVAIAARYLGDGARWPEIWRLNQPRYANRDPDVIYPGDEFVMPPEAVPPWLGAPGQPSGQSPPPPSPATSPWGTLVPDDLLEALVNWDLDKAFEILAALPILPPEAPLPPAPEYIEERAAFEAGMVDLTIKGVADPQEPPDDADSGEWER